MSAKPHVDIIYRGVKKPSPAGTMVSLGLGPLPPLLQLALLRDPPAWGPRLLSFVGLSAIPALPQATGSLPLAPLLLVLMSTAAAAKRAWWLTRVSYEYFPVGNALLVAGYNTLMDVSNSLLFLAATTSALSPSRLLGVTDLNPVVLGLGLPLTMAVGSALFVAGLGIEAVAEHQRRQFKERPESAGKLCRSGLWALSRHANYGGYVLWRAGYAVAASGWTAGVLVGLVQAFDFATRGIPAVEGYCAQRYGEQWQRYEKDVKYVLIPGIY